MRRVLGALAATLLTAACGGNESTDRPGDSGGPAAPPEPLRVGFLYVGPVPDFGWTRAHEEGRLFLQNRMPDVVTSYVPMVTAETAAATIDDLVAAGNRVVFTTSLDFMAATVAAPARHPDVQFFLASGFANGERLGSYMIRLEETEFLAGMVAGAMTRTGNVGVIGALRVSEQVMHIDAFARGVRNVRPDATVTVRWVGWWYDPPLEEIATRELIDLAGVDVLHPITDTPTGISVADARGVFSIGYGSRDFCVAAPETCLVTSYFDWGPLYLQLVQEVRNGTYPAAGRSDYVGLAGGEVARLTELAPVVPRELRQQVESKLGQLRAGAFHPFEGPFARVGGDPWVAAGDRLGDRDLQCMTDYVEGVVDLAGPACAADEDCGPNLRCEAGLCAAPDYAGCAP